MATKTIDYQALVVKADPDFHREKNWQDEYEFTKRTFRGRTDQRGAYADDD